MRQVLNPTTVRANPELLKRVGENAELKLLLMEPETILRLHPTDFKTYTLKNTTLEEMRAIRAALPKFRKDQHVQQEWTDVRAPYLYLAPCFACCIYFSFHPLLAINDRQTLTCPHTTAEPGTTRSRMQSSLHWRLLPRRHSAEDHSQEAPRRHVLGLQQRHVR